MGLFQWLFGSRAETTAGLVVGTPKPAGPTVRFWCGGCNTLRNFAVPEAGTKVCACGRSHDLPPEWWKPALAEHFYGDHTSVRGPLDRAGELMGYVVSRLQRLPKVEGHTTRRIDPVTLPTAPEAVQALFSHARENADSLLRRGSFRSLVGVTQVDFEVTLHHADCVEVKIIPKTAAGKSGPMPCYFIYALTGETYVVDRPQW